VKVTYRDARQDHSSIAPSAERTRIDNRQHGMKFQPGRAAKTMLLMQYVYSRVL
jgi:hypothetical protein